MITRAQAPGVITLALLGVVLILDRLKYRYAWSGRPAPTRFENRVRMFGLTASAVLYGIVLVVFKRVPIAWVQSHPRVLVAALAAPVCGAIAFIAVPPFWRWVDTRFV
ncbi:MAG: hypothetical protein ACREND_17195 [Gemmatimonadaceae bacterium]